MKTLTQVLKNIIQGDLTDLHVLMESTQDQVIVASQVLTKEDLTLKSNHLKELLVQFHQKKSVLPIWNDGRRLSAMAT